MIKPTLSDPGVLAHSRIDKAVRNIKHTENTCTNELTFKPLPIGCSPWFDSYPLSQIILD